MIVGHKDIKNFFLQQVENNRLANSYLFYGPQGIGKRTFAEVLATSLLCLDENAIKQLKPCNTCTSCRNIKLHTHPDFKYANISEDEKFFPISRVREVIEFLNLKKINNRRFVIIDDFERLNTQAYNALLKTIEEPPENVIILLISSKLDCIPKTILSRCQKMQFFYLNKAEAKKIISEKMDLTEEKFRFLLGLCGGSPGLIMKIHDSPVVLNRKGILEKCTETIFVNPIEFSEHLIKQINIENLSSEEARQNIKFLLSILYTFFRDVLYIMEEADVDSIINKDLIENLKKLGKKIHKERVIKIFESISETENLIEKNVNIKICLGCMFL